MKEIQVYLYEQNEVVTIILDEVRRNGIIQYNRIFSDLEIMGSFRRLEQEGYLKIVKQRNKICL